MTSNPTRRAALATAATAAVGAATVLPARAATARPAAPRVTITNNGTATPVINWTVAAASPAVDHFTLYVGDPSHPISVRLGAKVRRYVPSGLKVGAHSVYLKAHNARGDGPANTAVVLDVSGAPAPPAGSGDPGSYSTPQPVGPPGTWTMSFGDDFTGSALGGAWWNGRYGNGSSGDGAFNPSIEAEYFAASQVTVASSYCTLTAVPSSATIDGIFYTHKSGCLTSSTGLRFTNPGRYIEARIRVPNVQYCWPSFLSISDSGGSSEFDFFEFFGDQSGSGLFRPLVNYHDATPGFEHGGQTGATPYGNPSVDYRGSFHTYGAQIDASGTTITPYIDGVGYPSIGLTNLAHNVGTEQLLIFDLAVYRPNTLGTDPGFTASSAAMDIDWVRIWSS